MKNQIILFLLKMMYKISTFLFAFTAENFYSLYTYTSQSQIQSVMQKSNNFDVNRLSHLSTCK